MTIRKLIHTITRDFRRYTGGRGGRIRLLYYYFSHPGIRAVVLFRLATYLSSRGMTVIPALISVRILSKAGADIRVGAQIGPGLVMRHPIGVVIGHEVTIGEDCTILQNVTLGERLGVEDDHRCPIVGSRVTLCAGCVVTGPVMVGDNAIVAANAVVLQNVPADALALGIPATTRRRSRCDVTQHVDLDRVSSYIVPRNKEQKL
jgi:serine O-acetyltransferase